MRVVGINGARSDATKAGAWRQCHEHVELMPCRDGRMQNSGSEEKPQTASRSPNVRLARMVFVGGVLLSGLVMPRPLFAQRFLSSTNTAVSGRTYGEEQKRQEQQELEARIETLRDRLAVLAPADMMARETLTGRLEGLEEEKQQARKRREVRLIFGPQLTNKSEEVAVGFGVGIDTELFDREFELESLYEWENTKHSDDDANIVEVGGKFRLMNWREEKEGETFGPIALSLVEQFETHDDEEGDTNKLGLAVDQRFWDFLVLSGVVRWGHTNPDAGRSENDVIGGFATEVGVVSLATHLYKQGQKKEPDPSAWWVQRLSSLAIVAAYTVDNAVDDEDEWEAGFEYKPLEGVKLNIIGGTDELVQAKLTVSRDLVEFFSPSKP